MLEYTCYLGGAITGTSYAGCTAWREYAAQKLLPVVALNPMRHKGYLADEVAIADQYPGTLVSNACAIVARDRWDVSRCSVVLVNLLGTQRVSIGSVVEIGWADAYRKPIVLVMRPGNLHDHAFLRQVASVVADDLDQAIHVVRSLCL